MNTIEIDSPKCFDDFEAFIADFIWLCMLLNLPAWLHLQTKSEKNLNKCKLS